MMGGVSNSRNPLPCGRGSEAGSSAAGRHVRAATARERVPGMLVLLTMLAIASPVFAASARSLVSEGNQAYSQEDYEQALTAYKQAVESDPESPYARFNEGAAHYRKGEFDNAVSAYQDAAMLARAAERPTLEARSRYNLGNAFYQQGVGSGGQDPAAALAALEKSVGSYKEALRQDRSFTQAAHNLELARRQIQLLREQMKNQPQGGGENNKDDLQKKLEENLEKQNELNKESEEQSKQQDQDSEEAQQKSDELSKKQEQLQAENENLSKELESQQDQQSQQAKEHLDNAADQQQKAAEDLDNNQLEEAKSSQEKASEELQKALNAMKGEPSDSQQQPQQAQDQQQQQGDQNQQAQQPPPGGEQQPAAQALQLSPQDIIDEEKASRKSRQLQVLGTLKPVDKDW